MIGLPQSLRGLTVAFLGLFLAVTALAGFGTFFAMLSTIDQLVDRRIESESHDLVPVGETVKPDELKRRIAQMTSARDTGDLGIVLTDRQGHRIAGNARFAQPPPMGLSSLSHQDGIEGLSEGRVLVRDIGDGLHLTLFAETEPIDHYFAARRRIYIAGFGAIILVVLIGLLLFRRLIGKRIEQMRLTAQSIAEGDLSRRVPLAGDGGEFDRQAEAFNHMLDRISLLMAQIRNVSNDISHELRTPLARLRNELSLIEQQEEAEPVRPSLHIAITQADALLDMFGAMLRVAEIESGSRRAGFRPLALDELVAEIAEMAMPLAQEEQRQIIMDHCDPMSLTGDRQLLSQMLLNLLENAIRHTPPGTAIRVGLRRFVDTACLTVADEGPGIPAAQREAAMRRFSRLDPDRQRHGHGLGLPLADAIARLHHGTMRLEDAAPGLRVVVNLPL